MTATRGSSTQSWRSATASAATGEQRSWDSRVLDASPRNEVWSVAYDPLVTCCFTTALTYSVISLDLTLTETMILACLHPRAARKLKILSCMHIDRCLAPAR